MWYGKYIQTEKGTYSEEFNSKDALVRAYNSDGAMTLDEYQKIRGIQPPETSAETETTTTAASTAAKD
jgi:mannan endo-1,4-beta-mannosidase